jgi:hypothetical protein
MSRYVLRFVLLYKGDFIFGSESAKNRLQPIKPLGIEGDGQTSERPGLIFNLKETPWKYPAACSFSEFSILLIHSEGQLLGLSLFCVFSGTTLSVLGEEGSLGDFPQNRTLNKNLIYSYIGLLSRVRILQYYL